MTVEFDPYHTWMGIPKEEQPADYYRLLGVRTFEDNAEVIENAADQRMAYIRTFQNGPRAALSQQILNELSAARICLLSPLQKDEYDRRLRANLAAGSAAPPATPSAHSPGSNTPILATHGSNSSIPSAPIEPGGSSAAASGKSSAARRRRPLWSQPVFAAGATIVVLAIAVAAGVWSLLSQERGVAQSDPPPPTAEPAAPSAAVDKASISPASPPKPSEVSKDNVSSGAVAASQPSQPDRAPDAAPVSASSTSSEVEAAPGVPGPAKAPIDDDAAPVDAPSNDAPPTPASVLEESKQEDSGAAQEQPQRAAPPAVDVTNALDEVRRVLKNDLDQARLPPQKLALAKRMLELARETKADASRFALFKEASTLAAEGADVLLAFAIIDEMAQDFATEPVRHRVDALKAASALVRTPADRKQLAEAAFKETNAAIRAGLFDTAKQAARVATAAASRAGDAKLRLKARSVSEEVDVIKRKAEFAEKAAERLQIEPDNPKANLVWGQFLCFQRENWDQGLPHLAKGDDAALKDAAEKELAGPSDPAQQGDVADTWSSLAQTAGDVDKSALLSRAHHWYRQAAASAVGLTKARFNKRIDDIESEISQDELAAGDQVVPLIPLFDAARVVRGEWALQDGALVCSTQHFVPRLTFPYHPPEEYDYRIVFSQPQVRNGVSLILSKHDRSFSWVTGGATRPFRFTVGRLAGPNPTEVRIPGAQRPGMKHTALVQVRNEGIKAFFDGRQISGFATDYSQLDNDNWHEVPDEKALGVACDDPTVFHLIEVKEISGVGERVAPLQNASSTASQQAVGNNRVSTASSNNVGQPAVSPTPPSTGARRRVTVTVNRTRRAPARKATITPPGAPLIEEVARCLGFEHGVRDMAFSADGKLIAAAAHEALVRIWRTDSGEEVAELKTSQPAPKAIRFTADSKSILYINGLMTICRRTIDDGPEQHLAGSLNMHRPSLFQGSISRDGKLAITGPRNKSGFTGPIVLWDLTTGKELQQWPMEVEMLTHLNLSPDGEQAVASASYYSNTNEPVTWHLQAWNHQTNAVKVEFKGDDRSGIQQAQYSQDGRFLYAHGPRTCELHVWEAQTGERVCHTDFPVHTGGSIQTFVPLSGGHRVLTIRRRFGSGLYILDIETGQTLAQHPVDDVQPMILAVSNDGRRFAWGGNDGVVRICRIEWKDQ